MARTIPLSRGLVTVVDDRDFEWLTTHRWYANPGRNGSFYAARSITVGSREGRKARSTVREMQRIIMEAISPPPGKGWKVDHRNGDTLDNRRSNLRWASNAVSNQNRRMQSSNTSGYRGVWYQKGQGWRATIKANGVRHLGGTHATREAAALAYNRLALLHHGAEAKLNIVPSVEKR